MITVLDWLIIGLLWVQVPATVILMLRLMRAPFRRPPLQPLASDPAQAGQVSVIIPTLNEADRIQPCLDGLLHQGSEVREAIVVDSRSQDETVPKVLAMQQQDPRFQVITDDPLPSGWVGRPWALHTGFNQSHPDSHWILGLDADTCPQPGLVSSLLEVAATEGFDAITLAPRFKLEHWGEAWLQPALLVTLIYRFGAVGDQALSAERTMANGQCFLAKKSVLSEVDGYTLAAGSFCDDVTLVRALAARQFKVGFLDGTHLIQVRMYTSFTETWREWGRSLDLKDASSPQQVWFDAVFLLAVQGLPLLVLIGGFSVWLGTPDDVVSTWTSNWILALLGLNLALVLFRWGLLLGIYASYAKRPWTFWLSPLADPLAVARIWISSWTQPRAWRGRRYDNFVKQDLPLSNSSR